MKTTMKKEWSDGEFKAVERAIFKLFKGNISTLHGNHFITSFGQLNTVLGLAYTSSGQYAILGICNTNIWLDLERKFRYEMFCLGRDGNIYAELWDAEENEIYIKIGEI